jgi:hypothetical protein
MKGTSDLAFVPAANSGGTAARMPEGRRFQPGNSGNPRGRPKRDLEVAELARDHTEAALATLATIIEDAAAPASARVAAATAILDRGWGRPPQALNVTQRLALSEEFEAFVRALKSPNTAIGASIAPTVGSTSEEHHEW